MSNPTGPPKLEGLVEGGADIEISAIDRQLDAFRRRLGELRSGPPGPPSAEERLETALAELDLAEEELQVCLEELESTRQAVPHPDGDESRLLARAFAGLPVAVFLMNGDGSIRRVNHAASELLGFSESYLS